MTAPSLTAFPLAWPDGRKRTAYPARSKFETTFGRARDTLFDELKRLGAANVVLSTNVSLRKDGMPYADQREPKDGGVAVYFRRKGRDLVFCCDKWDRVADNLWAVVKTIEAIRGIERWGTGEMVEAAFSGFAALPPGPAAPPPPKTWREEFRDLFGLAAGCHQEEAQRRFRELAMEHHPDRGGDPAVMSKVNRLYAEWRKSRGL